MELQGKRKRLILTEEEKNILSKASSILDNIAELMDRAIKVEWSFYDDDEIGFACEVIDSFLEKDTINNYLEGKAED